MGSSITDYYQARAPEFEAVYVKPERQEDLARLKAWLAEEARGRTILEVACGTGYWTAIAADSARAIVATDLNQGPLALARGKGLGAHVRFEEADAFALPDYGMGFDAGMAHFWWSHVSVADQRRFLEHFASRLLPGAKLLMMDNNYVARSMTPISRHDALGNTYQVRRLESGAEYEIVKNFPSTEDLQRALTPVCARVDVLQLPHYWAVSATLG
jgi:demethylmenaquinone methyltransferase/2-methoxy-6-polyprenyl-1,4-benzoquinol methylase